MFEFAKVERSELAAVFVCGPVWCALYCAVRMDSPSSCTPMLRAFNGETPVKVILIIGPLCQAPGSAWNTLDA